MPIPDQPLTAENTQAEPPTPKNWWEAYPAARSLVTPVTPQYLASLMQDEQRNDYAVIDVRRNDHGGGHVRNSFQVPAQTFYDEIPAFFEKFGHIPEIIFYCSSSRGRAPRCAGWYQDYLQEHGHTTSKAYILEGGIKAWLELNGDNEKLVDRD